MSRYEKAPAVAATTTRAEEQAIAGELCGSHVPASDDTTPLGAWQVTISAFLSRGAVNAVPLRQLETVTGLDGRTVRRSIEAERRALVPICADNHEGYFLAANEMEKDRCVQSMRHRAAEILRTASALAEAEIEEATDG